MLQEHKKKEQELPDQWGSFFCLIEVGILSPSPGLLCTTRVQLQWLRPLVAPVSSSAPGRGDCPASLDPRANYFQSSRDLYHTHAGASGATAPPGSSFSGFSLLLGGQRLSPWTWAALRHHRSIWPAGWIWMFSRFWVLRVQIVSTFVPQQSYWVTEIIYPSQKMCFHQSIHLDCHCSINYNRLTSFILTATESQWVHEKSLKKAFWSGTFIIWFDYTDWYQFNNTAYISNCAQKLKILTQGPLASFFQSFQKHPSQRLEQIACITFYENYIKAKQYYNVVDIYSNIYS